MRESINLELIGIVGVLLSWHIWEISFRQYMIGLVFVITMLGVYIIYYVYNKNLKGLSFRLKGKEITTERLIDKHVIEVRRIGIFTISIGVLGIIGVGMLSSRVFIGIQVIGNAMGITASIIINTLIIELIILGPMLRILKRKGEKRHVRRKVEAYSKYSEINKIK